MKYVALALLACCSSDPAEIRPEPSSTRANAEAPRFAGALLTGLRSEPEPIRNACEPGQRRQCSRFPMGRDGGPFQHCVMGADGAYVWSRASCNTPLVVAFDDAPVRFIRPHGDASFAIGVENRTEWVSSDTPWLALDRNRNGCIDDQSELFAGFEALAALDDNHDERIDSSDEAFERLRLWIDSSHPRQCTSDELRPLSSYGIVALDLRWTDQRPVTQGSYEGERAPLQRTNGSRRGRVVDVHVAPTDD